MDIVTALLIGIATLLANPKVQANPVLFSQVAQINIAAQALIEEYTAQKGIENPIPLAPNQDTQTNPTGIEATVIQPIIQPTLASNASCANLTRDEQNPYMTQDAKTVLESVCVSTSTEMCTYLIPGRGTMQMYCVAIQLCSLEGDCPTHL